MLGTEITGHVLAAVSGDISSCRGEDDDGIGWLSEFLVGSGRSLSWPDLSIIQR